MRYKSNLNLEGLVEDWSASTLLAVGQAAGESWVKGAKHALNTTSDDYISAIRVNVKSGSSPSVSLGLQGAWANKLEKGFPSFDMKPGFATGDKTKISEEGSWYAHVPFTHRTTSATGRTDRTMPTSVYTEARKLPSWGKLSSNGSSKSWGKYGGIQKIPTNQSNTRHTYQTIRTVSENSSTDSFIHPGFEGVHLIDELEKDIPDTFSKLFGEG